MKDYKTFFIKDNPDYNVKEDKSIVLQAMHGDDINYDVGPFVIEFATNEERNDFYVSDELKESITHLNKKYNTDFRPITARDGQAPAGFQEV